MKRLILVIFSLFLCTGCLKIEEIKELVDSKYEKSISDIEWEYKIVSPDDMLFESDLNRYGKLGWELVTSRRASLDAYSTTYSYECI